MRPDSEDIVLFPTSSVQSIVNCQSRMVCFTLREKEKYFLASRSCSKVVKGYVCAYNDLRWCKGYICLFEHTWTYYAILIIFTRI